MFAMPRAIVWRHCRDMKQAEEVILAGPEPAIFGSEDQRLIH